MPKLNAKERLSRFQYRNAGEALVDFFRVFFFFFRYLRRHKFKVLLILLLSLLNGPIFIVQALITRFAVDDVVLATDVPLDIRLHGFTIVVMAMIAWYVVYITNKEILSVFVGYYLHLRLAFDVFRDMYRHQISLDVDFHRSRSIGEHMYRTSEDVTSGEIGNFSVAGNSVITLITNDWFGIVRVMSEFVIALGLFGFLDRGLGIIVGSYLILKLPSIHLLTTWKNSLELQLREVNQERYAVERDIIAGLKNFKSLGVIRFVKNRYIYMMRYTQEMFFKRMLLLHFIDKIIIKMFFSELFWQLGLYAYIYYGVMTDRFTVGDFFLMSSIAGRMEKPMEQLIEFIQQLRRSFVPARRMYETLSLKPHIVDRPGARAIPSLAGRIELRDVHFAYRDGPPILRGVSFVVEPGKRVAFVGPSGCGKSTIFKLLLRLHDPTSGQVLIDGFDLREIRLKSYLDQLGVLMQSTHIFSGSIEENIRYGDLFARKDAVEKAVDLAELRDYISSADHGIETFLGEGTKISGGQKQRVGIARTLIRHPGIFLMDEPTSALDVVVETEILKTIERVTRGTTSLFISHRIRPILWVDALIVLNKDGVEAVGGHEHLLKVSPTYQLLWQQQNVDLVADRSTGPSSASPGVEGGVA